MKKFTVLAALLCLAVLTLWLSLGVNSVSASSVNALSDRQRIEALEIQVAKLSERLLALELKASAPVALPVPTATEPVTETTGTSDVVMFSDFDFKFLSIRSNIYDEYSYKVTLTNNTDRAISLLVTFTFYDEAKFDIGTGDTQLLTLKARERKTITGKANIRYPEADNVFSAGINGTCSGSC